ncbi:MAG: hypothetical protein AVDCRST_MAG14-727, partial [uncultured Rubrobacteraceae bacterium]
EKKASCPLCGRFCTDPRTGGVRRGSRRTGAGAGGAGGGSAGARGPDTDRTAGAGGPDANRRGDREAV